MKEPLHIVFTTVPASYRVDKMCQALIREKLVACIWVLPPLHSYYIWDRNFERGREKLLMMKTRKNLVKALFQRIRTFHPYQVPELIAVKADYVSEAYYQWVIDATEKI